MAHRQVGGVHHIHAVHLLRRQAGVLALIADGERELVIRHGDAAAVGIGIQDLHAQNGGGRKRRGNIGGGVIAVIDDIDLFAAQLLHDGIDTGALGADAGADGIHILIPAGNGQLAAGARLAGDGTDLDRAVVNFGHFKLEKALRVFPVSPEGLTCIDCGASTGGFTDVLLKNGAAKVYAVDVGYGQLAWSLRSDSRVVVMERTNARALTPDMFPEAMDMAVMDLSFISVRLVLPAVHTLLKDGAPVVCLIKPQFEAGREDVGKKGVVREAGTHKEVLLAAAGYAVQNGFSVCGLDYSPIKGPGGNIEFLMFVRKSDPPAPLPEAEAERVVQAAHSALDA